MISFTYVSVFACCLAYAAAAEQEPKEGLAPPTAPEVAGRQLTDAGYVIRYGDTAYSYPVRIVPLIRQRQEKNPTETNEIESEDESKNRPLFYFTTYEGSDDPADRNLPAYRPYIEIRKKREATAETPQKTEVKENEKGTLLRKKRTYCGKCGGGGGYGGYYVPVTYAVYPVYYGGGGGGRGCNTCGHGGRGGYGGYGGGGGGSFSYSSSSSQSSAGSFGWGK